MANTLYKLDTITVGAGGATNIIFTNIPQTYTDLQIMASVRYGTNTTQTQSLGLYFNGDVFPAAATNRVLNGNGTNATSYTSSGFNDAGTMDDISATANTFSSHSIYIPNYVGSTFKSISVDSVTENNATLARANLIAGLYSSTAPITSIKLDTGGTALQYSTFTLYGVFKEDVNVPPATPTIGTATDGGTGTTASVAFTPVSGAASYTATSTPGSLTGTALTTPVTVGGLTTGTAYTFKVKANNPIGSSGESAASNSVTPVNPLSFDSIATITDSGGTASITFSSIPSTYKHLQIRAVAFQNLGNDWRGVTMRFNGDSGNNYSAHAMGSGGSTIGSSGNANTNAMYPVSAGWSSPNFPGVAVIDILDYASTTKNKTMRFLSGIERNTTPSDVVFGSGAWRNTAAITSITFTVNADNFTAGTRFALYGIKG